MLDQFSISAGSLVHAIANTYDLDICPDPTLSLAYLESCSAHSPLAKLSAAPSACSSPKPSMAMTRARQVDGEPRGCTACDKRH